MVARGRPVPPRLYFILAREAPIGVIFRRGPSRWVQVIKWNTKTDTFEPGQWFHGRIYEKRSDLSPDGTKMIYFAAKLNARTEEDQDYTYAWTAISKVPYLTAIVLWPKGDCWHGGGLFISKNKVWLNHKPERAIAHRSHPVPRGVTVIDNPEAFGEDDPVLIRRLRRDGWVLVQEWEGRQVSGGFATDQPEIIGKDHPTLPVRLVMQQSISKRTSTNSFCIEFRAGKRKIPIEQAEWADWDHNGRLVYIGDGKLFAASVDANGGSTPKVLADFSDNKPEPVEAPAWARVWGRGRG